MAEFSRQNPSLRYLELLGYYKTMHVEGATAQGIPPEQTFDGRSMPQHAARIRNIINVLGSKTILDYGSGKGKQYEPLFIETPDGEKFSNIKAFWNVESRECFDPAYEPYAQLPKSTFDGVVTTDVLEHCPKEDIPWIIDEIFEFATEFVYANVACYPAKKTLPNGENAHCTLEPPNWWEEIFQSRIKKTPGLRYFTAYDVIKRGNNGEKTLATISGSGKWNG